MDDRTQVSPRNTDGSRGRRPGSGWHVGPVEITPTRVMLVIAVGGSLAFFAYALTVRESTQIPLLAAGLLVLGLVFGALAVSGVIATYQAGARGRAMRATGLAIAGGLASIAALLCIAGAILLALVSSRSHQP